MKRNILTSLLSRKAVQTFALAAASLATVSATDIYIQPDEEDSKDTFGYSYSFLQFIAFDTDSGGLGASYGDILAAGNTSSNHDTRTFIEFSLADISGVATNDIDEVRLYLYVESAAGVGFGADPDSTYPAPVSLYVVDEAWTESTLTWFNQPSYSTKIGSTLNITGTGYWVAYDVTNVVKGWKTSGGNYGFALNQDNAVDNGVDEVYAVFHSSANTNKPYLKVTY